MKYEAIESFSGVISMACGEVREISNEDLAKDLLKAKLIKKYSPDDTKSLKKELDTANNRIAELESENATLVAEISSLREQLETPSEEAPEAGESETDGETPDAEETSEEGEDVTGETDGETPSEEAPEASEE